MSCAKPPRDHREMTTSFTIIIEYHIFIELYNHYFEINHQINVSFKLLDLNRKLEKWTHYIPPKNVFSLVPLKFGALS